MVRPMQHIIPIGGGGFTHTASKFELERYILAQTGKPSPNICFLPQASKEEPTYIEKFLDCFSHLGAKPSWISLFGRVENTWKQTLLEQDIIYVGGGNTKSMIALWKAWGVDAVLKEAYDKGIVLAGVSAGAICWFEQGITDSVWPLGVVEGLGFLKGSFCPHFDSEPERPGAYREKINAGQIQPGLALEDFTAAHYMNGTLHKLITSSQGKAFDLGQNHTTRLKVTTL